MTSRPPAEPSAAERLIDRRPADDEGWGDHSWAQSSEFVGSAEAVRPVSAASAMSASPRTPGAADVAERLRPAQPRPPALRPPSGPPALRPPSGPAAASHHLPAADAPPTPVHATTPTSRVGPGALSALWALVALAVALAVGVAVDEVADVSVGLRIGLVVGSLAAIVLVRLPAMFPVVVAPPLAYVVGSAAELVVQSGGSPKRSEILDFASNWLVYGFPTIVIATAIVVIGAAVRRRLRR